MADQTNTNKRRRTGAVIHVPGDDLKPRADFGRDDLGGASDRTVRRMNLPTIYLRGVAHVAVNASLKIIAEGVKRRNQPSPRGRGGGR